MPESWSPYASMELVPVLLRKSSQPMKFDGMQLVDPRQRQLPRCVCSPALMKKRHLLVSPRSTPTARDHPHRSDYQRIIG